MIPNKLFHCSLIFLHCTFIEHLLCELYIVHFAFFMSVVKNVKSGKDLLFGDSSGLIINPIY